MAKILVLRLHLATDKNINTKGCYFDSLLGDLESNGNEVMWLNTFQRLFYKEGSHKFNKWVESFLPKIKAFNPDIIFTFNNEIFESIIKVTNCPILLYEADLVDFFRHKEFIKKYNDRYYIATESLDYVETYKQIGFNEDRIILQHATTSVKREDKDKVNNISFIGSRFPRFSKENADNLLADKQNNLYGMFLEHWNEHNYDYQGLCKKYLHNTNISQIDCFKMFDPRVYVLTSVLDLGLKLYGVDWYYLPPEMLPLQSAFDETPVYSLQHNQDIYNSSYVNLSVNHPQCIGTTFPWRIYDIMASSGVLVSSYAEELKTLTKGYVDIPMYESPYDARDLCKKMLKEKNLREDIVLASNEFIEKFGRWQTNFEKIEDYTKVKITNNNCKGSIIDIDYELIIPSNKVKGRIKSFIYGMEYCMTQLPFVNELYGIKGRKKIYNKLLKYNKEFMKEVL